MYNIKEFTTTKNIATHDVELGKNYEVGDVNLMIKKLYDTTFFSDISVELENGVLSFFVKEKKIIFDNFMSSPAVIILNLGNEVFQNPTSYGVFFFIKVW